MRPDLAPSEADYLQGPLTPVEAARMIAKNHPAVIIGEQRLILLCIYADSRVHSSQPIWCPARLGTRSDILGPLQRSGHNSDHR